MKGLTFLFSCKVRILCSRVFGNLLLKRLFRFLVFFCFFVHFCFADEVLTKFEKRAIRIGKQKINVEIADTNEKAERGLMYRKYLKENDGMLFVFPDEARRSFWMKNTFIDLNIGFFDKNKTLIEIYEMKASNSELNLTPDSCETKKSAQFALEMSRGWFKRHNIKVGEKFEFSTSK
jgi:uncharacterized membrane protein (UPF0127 family)